MSSNKYYLRVANSWMKLFSPSGNSRYMANTSGLTIRVLIKDEDIDTSAIVDDDEHYFTVGGVSGQIVADSTKYVYARAVVDDPLEQGTIVTDTENITNDDITGIRDEIEFLTVQLMKLSKRVTTEELKTINHGVDYELFVRQFLDTTAQHHIQFSAIHKHIATIWEELLLAERFIQSHRMEYATLREMIDNIRLNGNADLRVEIEGIKADIIGILSNYATVVDDLSSLQSGLATTNQNYTSLRDDEVTPLKSRLTSLMNNFAALNNALVILTTDHTAAEIEEIFDDFIATVPATMVQPITAIKDDIIAIINNNGNGGSLSANSLFYIAPDTDVIEAIDTEQNNQGNSGSGNEILNPIVIV